MIKIIRDFIKELFLPSIDGNYVSNRLHPIIGLHGITVGESSLSFRGYDPIGEYRFPLKGSESTENHIKFKDIAIINERYSFMEILLWNGYVYTLSKSCNFKRISNTYRDVSNMSYFAIKRPISVTEVVRNMR